MSQFDTTPTDFGSMSIRIPITGTGGFSFDRFLSYEYHQDFLVPSDASSFTLAADEIEYNTRQLLLPGAKVEVSIDGQVQSAGYIRSVRTRSSRSSGTVLTIEVYDWFQRAVRAHIDPQTQFRESQTLDELLTAVFAPFGMTVLATDNIANRNAITGRIYGTKTSKKGKALKSIVLHEIKPYPQEGAYAFASRVSQRFGLWLWPAADGQTVIVGKPDFDQPARYTIRQRAGNAEEIYNNVLESDVDVTDEGQPSIIFASGYGGGGEFAKSTLRGGIINPLIGAPNSSILAAYPNVKFVLPPIPAITSAVATIPIPNPNACPIYLYDPESHTQDQLNNFLLRELSLHMRKSLVAKYTIEGHKLNGQPVAVDTIVDVDDDRSNLHLPLYVQARRFSKKGGTGGTTTQLELIRPGTLIF